MFLAAILPILVILVLMVGFQWRASRAGAAGYLIALTLGAAVFGTGIDVLGYAHAKGVFLTLDVLYIIWPAYLLFKVVDEAGGIAVLGEALPTITADRGMQGLLIGWVFASFLQGVGGFGVPVAVIAPILVGLGFPPLQAVVIPSIGHSWSITFGSLGSSFNALMAATGLGWETLAGPAAIYLGFAGIFAGFLILWTIGRWSAVRRLWLPTLLLGISMTLGQYLTVTRGFWSIGTLAAGSLGLLIGVPLARMLREPAGDDRDISWRQLLVSLSGYIVLVFLTLLVQLIPAVRDFLGEFILGVEFPALSTASGYTTPAGPGRQIPIFRHAGAILLISAGVSWIVFRSVRWAQAGSLSKIFQNTVSRMIPSSMGITSMVMMAVIMQHAGMINILARGLSTAVRWAYPAVSPWLGALGAFMTGSNTNSNLVMASLQLQTADYLGIPAALILAAQTAGGALGSVISPTKVIVGASTAGVSGQEGEVMRLLLPPVSGLIFLISVLSFLGTLIS